MLLNISNFVSFCVEWVLWVSWDLWVLWGLVQESEEPEWDLVAFATLHLVDSEDDLRLALQLGAVLNHTELLLSVEEE